MSWNSIQHQPQVRPEYATEPGGLFFDRPARTWSVGQPGDGELVAPDRLRLNGLDLDLTDDEAFDLTMTVAAGQSNAEDIEKRPRTRRTPR